MTVLKPVFDVLTIKLNIKAQLKKNKIIEPSSTIAQVHNRRLVNARSSAMQSIRYFCVGKLKKKQIFFCILKDEILKTNYFSNFKLIDIFDCQFTLIVSFSVTIYHFFRYLAAK